MTDKPKRPTADWEAIRREYRAGQFSNREIGHQHGVSHTAINKRAKAEGWSRDLSKRVREEVSARLVSGVVSGASEAEAVETAAARGVDIVLRHRADLSQLHGLLRTVMGRITAHLDGGIPDGPGLGEKETPLDAIEKASRILGRTIPLERQAFNLDEVKDGGMSLEQLIVASWGRETAEPLSGPIIEHDQEENRNA